MIFGPGERSYRLFVSIEGAEKTAGFDIPNTNLGICTIASAEQPRSIRANAPYISCVPTGRENTRSRKTLILEFSHRFTEVDRRPASDPL